VAFAQQGDRAKTETNLSTAPGIDLIRTVFGDELKLPTVPGQPGALGIALGMMTSDNPSDGTTEGSETPQVARWCAVAHRRPRVHRRFLFTGMDLRTMRSWHSACS